MMSDILKSAFVRDVGKLLSANVVAQVIGLLVYPLLTRLYAPDDFALSSLFTSIAGVLTLFATAEYQYAIVLPGEEHKAWALRRVCLLLLGCIVAATCLALPLSPYIASLFKTPDLAGWLWLLPVYVAAAGLWNILNYVYIRRSAFTRISAYQITNSVFAAGGKIGFGVWGGIKGGLILSLVLAPLVALIGSVAAGWKTLFEKRVEVNSGEMRAVAAEYANFPKFNLPRAIVNSVGLALPVWIFTPCFGLEKTGYLSVALLVAFAPLNIIARACYQVLFQRVSASVQKRQSIRSIIKRFLLWLGSGLVIGMAVVYMFVPDLVTLILGAEWGESAYIIQRLFPYLLLMPICGSICFLSDVFAKQKTAMWMEIGYVAIMAVVLLVSSRLFCFLTVITLYSLVGFGYLCVQMIWFFSLIRQYERMC